MNRFLSVFYLFIDFIYLVYVTVKLKKSGFHSIRKHVGFRRKFITIHRLSLTHFTLLFYIHFAFLRIRV